MTRQMTTDPNQTKTARCTGLLAGGLLMLACAAAAQSVAEDLPAPGLYEVTTRTTYTDVPLPDTTVTTQNCLTQEDLEQDPASVFAELPEGKSCDVGEFDMSSGNISMQINCNTGDGDMTMVTRGTYDDDGYDMVSDVAVAAGEQKVRMQSTIEGKRLGDC